MVALLPVPNSGAQTDAGTVVTEADVNATLAEGAARLKESGRTISDLVIRHADVGGGNLGVSVVQRTRKEAGGPLNGIAHVKLDEIYYVEVRRRNVCKLKKAES